jgi:hypothetical protein
LGAKIIKTITRNGFKEIQANFFLREKIQDKKINHTFAAKYEKSY